MRIRNIKWTDEQLSMLLSHVAGGGTLCFTACCTTRVVAKYSAWTIVVQGHRKHRRANLEQLGWWAYNALGCTFDGKLPSWVLRNAEDCCSGGGP